MKNKIIIGVVVLVVVIAAGAWYFLSRGANPAAPYVGTPAVNSNGTSLDTLAAILASGRPVKCTVAPSADNGNMSGTFYIANGKTRGDYSVSEGAQPMSGHMIVLGDTSYSWFEGQSTGFKMTATPASGNENNPAAPSQGFDPNQKIGYDCSPWSADASLFALPANVKFTDMSALGAPTPTPPVGGAAGAGAGAVTGNAAQCATCNQLPAEYKVQCLTQLGCN